MTSWLISKVHVGRWNLFASVMLLRAENFINQALHRESSDMKSFFALSIMAL